MWFRPTCVWRTARRGREQTESVSLEGSQQPPPPPPRGPSRFAGPAYSRVGVQAPRECGRGGEGPRRAPGGPSPTARAWYVRMPCCFSNPVAAAHNTPSARCAEHPAEKARCLTLHSGRRLDTARRHGTRGAQSAPPAHAATQVNDALCTCSQLRRRWRVPGCPSGDHTVDRRAGGNEYQSEEQNWVAQKRGGGGRGKEGRGKVSWSTGRLIAAASGPGGLRARAREGGRTRHMSGAAQSDSRNMHARTHAAQHKKHIHCTR
jgi:hypothetical protein